MEVERDVLRAWRLASQRLDGRGGCEPAEVVRWLGGVQAQNDRRALWSIGLRAEGCTKEDVERALREGQIVRTWTLRGTLHFVAAGDRAWLTALLAPEIIRQNARRYRQLGLDDRAFARSQEAIREVLGARGPLVRAEIGAHLERAGLSAQGQRLPYLLQRAALDGLIAHGPRRRHEPTYALLPQGAGGGPALDREEALARLAARYVASHGPATYRDFAWWAGLGARDARRGLEAAPGVEALDAGDAAYWVCGAPPSGGGPEGAHLLPPYDEYLLGYKERDLVLDPSQGKRVNAGGGVPKPAVLSNGRVVGTWSDRARAGGVTVSVSPFYALDAEGRGALEGAARRWGRFNGTPVEVRIVTGG
jgi:hypothetical protein